MQSTRTCPTPLRQRTKTGPTLGQLVSIHVNKLVSIKRRSPIMDFSLIADHSPHKRSRIIARFPLRYGPQQHIFRPQVNLNVPNSLFWYYQRYYHILKINIQSNWMIQQVSILSISVLYHKENPLKIKYFLCISLFLLPLFQ